MSEAAPIKSPAAHLRETLLPTLRATSHIEWRANALKGITALLSENDRLTEEVAMLREALMMYDDKARNVPAQGDDMSDHTEKLAAFAREVIRDAWNRDIDGGGVQDAAEHHGLIVRAIYDTKEHGDGIDAGLGDEILVFADWLA